MTTLQAKPSSKKTTTRVWRQPVTVRYRDPELVKLKDIEEARRQKARADKKSGNNVLIERKTTYLSANENSPFLSSLITPEMVKAQWASRQGLTEEEIDTPIHYQHGLTHKEVTSMLGALHQPLLMSAGPTQPQLSIFASPKDNASPVVATSVKAQENARNLMRREIAQRILGLDTMNNKELTKVHIQQAINHFQRQGPLDSGSADVQGMTFFLGFICLTERSEIVAIMTVRIRNLEKHLMQPGYRRDTANRVKLQHMRDQRRKMLNYLRRQSLARFQWLVNQLGLPVTA